MVLVKERSLRSSISFILSFIIFGVLISSANAVTHDQSRTVVLGGKMYIATNVWNASTSSSENKVWVYDGSNTPTSIKDFGTSSVSGLYGLGNKIVALLYESSSYVFYVYDPSESSWGDAISIGTMYPSYFTEFSEKLYFSNYTSNAYSLYSFDGTTVSALKSFDQYFTFITTYNSKLYLGSNSRLYSYDGSSFTDEAELSSNVNRSVNFNNKLYFTLWSSESDSYRILSYDGSSIVNVLDIGKSYPEGLVVVGSKLYYSAYNSSSSNYTLYAFDGSATSQAANISQYPNNLTAYKGRLIFSTWDMNASEEVIKEYDGTNINNLASAASPPSKATDLVSSDASTYLNSFQVMNGILYYLKGASSIWKYEIQSIAFASGYPFASNISTTTLDLFVSATADGTAYYIVLADGSSAPTSAQVKAGTDSGGSSSNVIKSGSSIVQTSPYSTTISLSGLTLGTAYDIWLVSEDDQDNLQSTPDSINVSTTSSAVGTFASGYPNVTIGSAGTSATLKVKSGSTATLYYVVLANQAATPSSNDVKNGTGKAGSTAIIGSGSTTLTSDQETSVSITGLTASTEYDIYVVLGVSDGGHHETLQSNATRVDISTDVTPAAFASGYPSVGNEGTTSFTVKVKFDDGGTSYFVVLADGSTRPDTTKIKAGQDASGNAATASGKMIFSANVENTKEVTNLTTGLSYDVWVTAEDSNGNLTTAKKADVTTLAKPKIITVKQDGSGDHATIGDAINAASSATADTILVYDGTYTENINYGGKNLVLKSQNGPQKTIITPSNNGLAIVWFYNGEPATAKLVGFTLTGGGDLQGSAINIDPTTGGVSSNPSIENCIITASKGYPVRFFNSSTTIKNTVLHDNTGDGVFYFDTYTISTYPGIINCTIVNNSGYGIRNAKTYRPAISNSIIWGNSLGGAFGNLNITYSIVQGGYTGTGNKNSDPLFVSSTDFDITNYSPAIGSGTVTGAPIADLVNTSRGSPPDMGAYENALSRPLTDTVIPIVNYVREGLSGNDSYAGSSTQLSVHWNGSDAASGIGKYEYAIDDVVGENSGGVLGWTSAGSDTSVIAKGLTLTEGNQYFVSVRATDKLGNVSNIVTSDGVIIDLTAPTIGSVLHGSGSHLSWLGDTSSVTTSWSGFADGASGIKEYEVMIRDSTSKTNETDWVIVPDSLISHTFTDLDLDNNSQYFLKARASDKVGNISSVVESGLFQVDSEDPTVTTLLEVFGGPQFWGSNIDIDWFGPNNEITHLWKGADNGEILHYNFSIGTAEQTNEIRDRNVGLDTTFISSSDSTFFENFEEGKVYFSYIQVKDKAGNLSELIASDGFELDNLSPISGEVIDGDGEDLDISTSMTSITVSWKGFDDVDSGIDHYLVSLGKEPGEDDVQSEIEVSDNEFVNITGLNLKHGETYYSSVVAVDLVGNASEKVTSNGFAVDEYPGPPTVTNVSFGNDSFLSLVSDEKLVFHFSEPIDTNVEVTIASSQGADPSYGQSESQDSLIVNLKHPLISLDTIFITLSDFSDLSGRVAEDTVLTFYTELLGDYNHDLSVDIADLATLASRWSSQDFTFELGPVSGEAPHFIPQPDGVYNLRDIMAYTRMWRWNRGSSNVLNFNRSIVGDDVDVSYVDKNLNIIVSESAMAGQLAFRASSNETFLSLPEEKSGEIILLSHSEPALKESVIDFAYLKGEGNRLFILPVEHGREASTINMSYVFYNSEGNISSEGIKTIDIIPLPAEFVLDQNYPNPFNPTTRIEYGLPINSDINLTIYDLLGQEVRTLISKDYRQAGYHNSIWDARDKRGQIVSAGVYIYRLSARGDDGKNFALTKKMILLK